MKYKGRELADPITIIRRLLCMAVVCPLMPIIWLCLLFGYGLDEANNAWENVF